MSITAISGITPEWFTPAQDDEENPTRFKVRSVTGPQYAEIMTTVVYHKGAMLLTAASIPLCLRYGLIDWENLKDDDGNAIDFSDSNLARVPGSDLFVIAGRIFELSTLSEATKKKS